MDSPDSDKENILAALQKLFGDDSPEEGMLISGSFAVTPNGLEGDDMLAMMFAQAFSQARLAGAPPDILRLYGTGMLATFAMAIATSLAGAGEIDEENHLARFAALTDLTQEQKAEIAIGLGTAMTEFLSQFSQFLSKRAEESQDEPELVDPAAARELAKLFEAEAAEDQNEAS